MRCSRLAAVSAGWTKRSCRTRRSLRGGVFHPISDWAIGEGEGQLQWAHLRAKDLEQMSHEKGFSLVSVVVH